MAGSTSYPSGGAVACTCPLSSFFLRLALESRHLFGCPMSPRANGWHSKARASPSVKTVWLPTPGCVRDGRILVFLDGYSFDRLRCVLSYLAVYCYKGEA